MEILAIARENQNYPQLPIKLPNEIPTRIEYTEGSHISLLTNQPLKTVTLPKNTYTVLKSAISVQDHKCASIGSIKIHFENQVLKFNLHNAHNPKLIEFRHNTYNYQISSNNLDLILSNANINTKYLYE